MSKTRERTAPQTEDTDGPRNTGTTDERDHHGPDALLEAAWPRAAWSRAMASNA